MRGPLQNVLTICLVVQLSFLVSVHIVHIVCSVHIIHSKWPTFSVCACVCVCVCMCVFVQLICIAFL